MEQFAVIGASIRAVVMVTAISFVTLCWRAAPVAILRGSVSDGDVLSVVDALRLERCEEPQRVVQRDDGPLQDIIARADRAAKNIRAISEQLRKFDDEDNPRVHELLETLDEASADARQLVADAKRQLQQ